MNRLLSATVLAFALAGCASAPPQRQPVAADPMSCTGDRFYAGGKSYASCIRHVASPPHAMPPIRSALRKQHTSIPSDALAGRAG